MQSNLIVTLVALALAVPAVVLAAPAGSGGGGGGSSGGGSSSGSSGGSGGSSGGGSGGGSSGGHGGGGGGGSAHGGTGAGGGGFAARSGGGVARYGIQVGPHNGGQGAPALEQLTHGAAHAVRIENAAHAMPVEDRTHPPHPHVPKVRPVVPKQSCNGDVCPSQFQQFLMPNLYCNDRGVDDPSYFQLDCPRAIKTRPE
jgi:hypothetical protein